MKRYLTILTAALSMGITAANAQMSYNVIVQNQSYTPLTGATNVNGLTPWTDSSTYVVPLGFNFKLGGKTISKLSLIEMNSIGTDTAGIVSGFSFLGTALIDRGTITGSSKSPIRYATTGTAGKRIFKLEFLNAGFSDEHDIYSSLNDSINLQIWLHEDSNTVELRYGPSKITHFNDYFFLGGPMIWYIKNANIVTESFEMLYGLKGNPASPTIDSTTASSMNFPNLSAYPANGTVYRFVPKASATVINKLISSSDFKVYPTYCSDKLFVETNKMETFDYQVISIAGSTMLNGKASYGQTVVDVSGLPAGMYVLTVKNHGDIATYKFVKQ